MKTKLQQLREFMASGDYHAALRLAASWGELGPQKTTIQKAWAAKTHPRFYKEIKQDPEKLVQAGLDAIRERYGIE